MDEIYYFHLWALDKDFMPEKLITATPNEAALLKIAQEKDLNESYTALYAYRFNDELDEYEYQGRVRLDCYEENWYLKIS